MKYCKTEGMRVNGTHKRVGGKEEEGRRVGGGNEEGSRKKA